MSRHGTHAETAQEAQERREEKKSVWLGYHHDVGCLSGTIGQDHCQQYGKERWSCLFWIRVTFIFFISRHFLLGVSVVFYVVIRVDARIRESDLVFEFGGFIFYSFLPSCCPCDRCAYLIIEFPTLLTCPAYYFFLLYVRGIPNKGCKTASINKQRKEELLQERARLNKEHARMMQLRAQVDGAIRDTLTNESTAR